MRLRRPMATGGPLLLACCTIMLLQPTVATGASCITTVAGDVCLAKCIGAQEQACGSDVACHKGISAVLQMLGRTHADTEDCANLVGNIRQVCGCVASPSGAFLD